MTVDEAWAEFFKTDQLVRYNTIASMLEATFRAGWAARDDKQLTTLVRDLAEWKLPETGLTYPGSGNPVPYDSAYANGSQGARIYWQTRAQELLVK